MKNEMLDTPFHEQISDALNKGETILWSEKPKKKNWFSLFDIIVIIFSISLLVFHQSFSPVSIFAFLVGGGFLFLLLTHVTHDDLISYFPTFFLDEKSSKKIKAVFFF